MEIQLLNGVTIWQLVDVFKNLSFTCFICHNHGHTKLKAFDRVIAVSNVMTSTKDLLQWDLSDSWDECLKDKKSVVNGSKLGLRGDSFLGLMQCYLLSNNVIHQDLLNVEEIKEFNASLSDGINGLDTTPIKILQAILNVLGWHLFYGLHQLLPLTTTDHLWCHVRKTQQ